MMSFIKNIQIVADGVLTQKIRSNNTDEIDLSAHVFNKMTDNLRQMFSNIVSGRQQVLFAQSFNCWKLPGLPFFYLFCCQLTAGC